jgi:hypothetical protein
MYTMESNGSYIALGQGLAGDGYLDRIRWAGELEIHGGPNN